MRLWLQKNNSPTVWSPGDSLTSHVDSDQFSFRLENDSLEQIFNEDIDMILLYMMFYCILCKRCVLSRNSY